MVPGGQAEMVLTYRMFNKQQPEYAVYTRHKGARAAGGVEVG